MGIVVLVHIHDECSWALLGQWLKREACLLRMVEMDECR